MSLPQPVTMAAAIMKQFAKDHMNCVKTWEPLVVDMSLSERNRAIWWISKMNGEHGVSSEVMWRIFFHGTARIGDDSIHPSDPDDFRRCHLLLEAVPEWRDRMDLLKPLSPVWARLVENWDKLTEMLKEQMAGKKNDMYKFMKELGC